MKIFGWMHKKLHMGAAEYHRVAHRNSTDVLVCELVGGNSGGALPVMGMDTEALLIPQALLLTIGTFGHTAAPPPTPRLEEDPSAFDLQLQADEIAEQTAFSQQSTPAFHLSNAKVEPIDCEKNAKQEIEIVEEETVSEEPLLKEDKEKIGRRTTLADLFAAETAASPVAAAAGVPADGAGTFADKRQPTRRTKKAKKPKGGKESESSGKKIQGLITRMLKKRIHPDAWRGERDQRQGGGPPAASHGG